jgi:hypothetical protein
VSSEGPLEPPPQIVKNPLDFYRLASYEHFLDNRRKSDIAVLCCFSDIPFDAFRACLLDRLTGQNDRH